MDPLLEAADAAAPLRLVADAAAGYMSALADEPVVEAGAAALLDELDGPLPEAGVGGVAALDRLLRVGTAAATRSSGPNFFHFVIGGSTPAAMAGDWLTALVDQNVVSRVSSAFGSRAEDVAIRWLLDLFGLPSTWGGALVASATFGNFTGLGAATHWWGERHGVDTTADGLAGLPRMPVLSGGYLHASARKALQMLGHGRSTAEIHARDDAGRVDVDAIDARLAEIGAPAVVVANAGDVNTGDFDPIDALADVCARHGAWLHVDGAFGLFAALSPRTAPLLAGIDRADSVAADGHKWLNVPYESGFAFLRDPARLGLAFGMPGAPYLPDPTTSAAGYGAFGPESSRRARAVPIWATLAAYGRDGYRALVERHLDLAQRLAARVDDAPDLERLADVPLCVVCFRYAPPGVPGEALDDLNRRLGAALLDDGRVFAGTTVHRGRVALRPAITNWRTTDREVDRLVDVVREIGARLTG